MDLEKIQKALLRAINKYQCIQKKLLQCPGDSSLASQLQEAESQILWINEQQKVLVNKVRATLTLKKRLADLDKEEREKAEIEEKRQQHYFKALGLLSRPQYDEAVFSLKQRKRRANANPKYAAKRERLKQIHCAKQRSTNTIQQNETNDKNIQSNFKRVKKLAPNDNASKSTCSVTVAHDQPMPMLSCDQNVNGNNNVPAASCCILCGKGGRLLIECCKCSTKFHLPCLQPSINLERLSVGGHELSCPKCDITRLNHITENRLRSE